MKPQVVLSSGFPGFAKELNASKDIPVPYRLSEQKVKDDETTAVEASLTDADERMTKPIIYYDPVLAVTSTPGTVLILGNHYPLEARIAELEAETPGTVTVQVPVDRIVERIVEVEVPGPERIVEVEVPGPERVVERTIEVPGTIVERVVEVEVPGPERIVERVVEVEVDREDIAFNRKYINILRDHIEDLNQFAIDSLSSEDALASP